MIDNDDEFRINEELANRPKDLIGRVNSYSLRIMKNELAGICVGGAAFVSTLNFLEGQRNTHGSSKEVYILSGIIALTGLIIFGGGRYYINKIENSTRNYKNDLINFQDR